MPPEYERRSKKYLIFRLLIILMGFGLVTFYQVSLGPVFRANTFRYLYGLLGLYLVFGLVLFVTYPRWQRRRGVLRWQVLADFAFQALLVWGTGGVLSIFSPLLFVTLVAATTVISARGSFVLASVATLFLTLTTVAYAFGFSPVNVGAELVFGHKNSMFLVSYLLGSILALYTISALGSRFSHGLRSMEGMQSEILENMAEGLVAVDRDGDVLHLNREARKLLGVPGNAPRLDLETLLPAPEHLHLKEAFYEGYRQRFGTVLRSPDGREVPVEVKISSVDGDVGEPRYRIGLISDQSLRREVEAAERRILKLEDFQVMSLGIAHEIRNPLASIRGCVQEIARISRGNGETLRYMEIVCRESDRLDKILEDFLKYARTGPLEFARVDLVQIVDEAVFLLRSRPQAASRTITWSPPSERPEVLGDRDRLIEVLLNLGLNAIEATAEGGSIRIEMRSKAFPAIRHGSSDRDPVEGTLVEVTDDGAGVRAEDREKVFTPFFTTKSTGSGLGLCVVDRVVREHMGVVDFSSDEGKGSTFRVWLPRAHAPAPGSTAPAEEQLCHA